MYRVYICHLCVCVLVSPHTHDACWSTHMPLHALVTLQARSSGSALTRARVCVTRNGHRANQVTLTLLTPPAWLLWVAMVTSHTPVGGDGEM